MDSEQILIDIFKQQHYDATRDKMQKIILILSAVACSAGIVVMSVFYSGFLYIYTFAGAVICIAINLVLVQLKAIVLNTASFFIMLYLCFLLIPAFWYLTGVMGSAPYVSIIILVALLSMFSGKMLKGLLFSYLGVLLLLCIYSAFREIPTAEDVPAVVYTLAAYSITVVLTATYMLSKLKKFDQLNDKFLRSSFKDELTRVYNRKLLDIIIQYEEAKHKKEGSDYIFVMFDIDKFKQMNDENGHVFGDIVLRNVAKCINEKVRSTDFVVRYGGDEFLVVQTNSTPDSVVVFLERIDKAMETSCYLNVDISVSYGYAARSECKTPQEVLELADKRLYEKKEASKNKQ